MDRVIICEPRKDCADPHIHRWYCMRGHELDDIPAVPGVCPLDKCEQRGANQAVKPTPKPPKTKPRGICSECSRDIALRNDGTIRGHGRRDIYIPWCPGSLRPPTALVRDGRVYAKVSRSDR